MKLTPENIAAIEDLLTRHENGEKALSCGDRLFPGQSKFAVRNKYTGFMAFMRALGVPIPSYHMGSGIAVGELAEFRAWKAAQKRAAE